MTDASTLSLTSAPSGPQTPEESSCVQVAVRVRPMLAQEARTAQCIEVLSSSQNNQDCNIVRLGGEQGPKFTFDQVFPISTKQLDIYQQRVLPLVKSLLEGFNATILAYGQTGSGKTHTIMGPSASLAASVQDKLHAGVIPRAIQNIFSFLLETKQTYDPEEEEKKDDAISDVVPYRFEVRVQFLEVYGETIRDLLVPHNNSTKLTIRDVGLDEPEVVGASEHKVESAEEALLCLTRGMYRRVTGATAMNETSSRSHAFFSLIVEQSTVDDTTAACENHMQFKRSKFNFVDLAGSERQKRTKAEGLRLKEGIDINQGLLVLGNVISALGDPHKRGKAFVPYRDSKLTRLLKGSLGGNHKTLMIACISPSSNNMEETLNCLRYANRAKNIQNHAVVNLDATSRMLADLKNKLQLLATDLLKEKRGEEGTVPLEVIQSIAQGGDGENIPPSSSPLRRRIAGASPLQIEPMDTHFAKVKAENEAFQIQIKAMEKKANENSFDTDSKDNHPEELQQAFVARTAKYVQEIAHLKQQLVKSRQQQEITPSKMTVHIPSSTRNSRSQRRLFDDSSTTPRERSESPELGRLRAQVFGSMAANPNFLDAEVEAEERAAVEVMKKFLKDDEELKKDDHPQESQSVASEGMTVRLEADLHEISTSINAKEDLIQKLLVTQEKFELMRKFYEGKLVEMEMLLCKSEVETEKLSQELNRLEKGHSSEENLRKKLREKQEQVAELRNKQRELTRLTSVATRNESQISKLRNEVTEMKQKKVDLQKQIISERKQHHIEVQKLKKETMKKERELNKVKKTSDKRAQEADNAKKVAKSRLENLNQLKFKYKESEKRFRMQTLKRGVMSKAGYDPVMVGRRQPKKGNATDNTSNSINVDTLRDFFDQQVADMGRKEALAEKLAQEWEEHLELSIQREEQQVDKGQVDGDLISQIKYKEDRIRQLASRLGKRESEEQKSHGDDESFLFNKEFKAIVGAEIPPPAATKTAARVLFGMVVRERRRIASLARTASLLDDKVQEAEAASMAKAEAFRVYVNEQRVEAAAQAQSQQEHILSLMEMVKEEPSDVARDTSEPKDFSSAGNSKLLVLANERIAALERQLYEVQQERESLSSYHKQAEESKFLLRKKTSECKELEEEIGNLRSALRRIREDIAKQEISQMSEDITPSLEYVSNSKKTLGVIEKALHPRPASPSKQRRQNNVILNSSTVREVPDFDLEYNSSGTDELPDWATSIMEDLAIIAEGKMPSSLQESAEVVNAEARLDDLNVFDRLTNPSAFTGTQKLKSYQPKPKQSKSKPKETISADKIQKQMVVSIQAATDSISKMVVPPLDSESLQSKRSVFDRLISPSNATGTQKNRLQDHHRENNARSDSTSEAYKDDSHSYSESLHEPESVENLDFAERLNNTTTQAYAVNQQVREAEKILDNILNSSDGAHIDDTQMPATSSFERVQEYTQQNVFERLQKTTTQAYAVKQNVSVAEKLLDSVLDSNVLSKSPSAFSPHISSNSSVTSFSSGSISGTSVKTKTRKGSKSAPEYDSVFERLHNTTTEAAAKKSHRSSRPVND